MTLTKSLNETEKAKLVLFNKDEVLKGAVEKVLLSAIYNMGTLTEGEPAGEDKNWAYGCDNGLISEEEVGKRLRVKITALSYLESAWKELGAFQEEIKEVKEEENPAI